MGDGFEILGILASGIPVIELTYTAQQMLAGGTELAESLLDVYEELSAQAENPSVAIHIHADTAGSPVIRALARIHFAASRKHGRVVCVGYPADYLQSLTSLGLLLRPDFAITGDLDSALLQLKRGAG